MQKNIRVNTYCDQHAFHLTASSKQPKAWDNENKRS